MDKRKLEHAERRFQRRERARKVKGAWALTAYTLTLLLILALLMAQQEIETLKKQNTALGEMLPMESYEAPSRGTAERMESLGEFRIYHYCPCAKCCGKSIGITATGTRAREGRTIAVDPDVIPLGSEVIIDGEPYIAEDTGAGITGNKIDMFVASHERALQMGVRSAEVYIKK